MIVYDLKSEDFEYAYRVDGPYDEQKGLLFDKTKILLDPYAQAVAGQEVWGHKRTRTYHARVVRDSFDWGVQPQSTREMSDLIIYELHVRGFTNHSSSGVKHPGTFAGLKEKIPYLKELGINAVELMPIFEFDEMINAREVDGKQLVEYWGYNTVGFFSPNASYTAAEEVNNEGQELKELIRELHENGIEVILDVVFNHTAEGNENGPFFSFKGFDNNIYYLLTPEGNYYNFSGCGNSDSDVHQPTQLAELHDVADFYDSLQRCPAGLVCSGNRDGADSCRAGVCIFCGAVFGHSDHRRPEGKNGTAAKISCPLTRLL